jgi:hypothetical protein
MLDPDTQPNTVGNPGTAGDARATHTHADYSLRASGRTYVERAKEAQAIVDRIKTSSGSVIGIAGVRGAGKSSLAKKVLGECDGAGFFTLMIPSPTESEPKEFLLATFQRIAEHATEKVQTIIEGAESLAELGDRQAQRLRRQIRMLFGGLALLCVVGGAADIWWNKIQADARNVELSKDLNAKQEALTEERQRRKPPVPVPPSPSSSQDKASAPLHDYPGEEIANLDKDSLQNFRARLPAVKDSAGLDDISAALSHRLDALGQSSTFNTKQLIGWAIGALLCLALLVGFMYGLRVFRKLRILRANKIRVGLLSKCRTFMELIRYQSVLATSAEYTVAPKFFSSVSAKFGSSKQLQDRPLSLPGLTATCSDFLQNVAEVFSGKVVICIDELDKITNVSDLFKLLKGIKGILGQENSHFILTVSEDAMAFFNERLSRERSLVESSFEEIVYLDRLNRDVTNKLIRQSLGVTGGNSEDFLRNCTVQWIFAGGIPREIKRNLFASFSQNISMNDNSSVELWRLLYLRMLNSMLAMSPPKEAGGMEDQYKFLICIETLIDRVEALPKTPDFRNFAREVMGIFRLHFGSTFRSLLDAPQTNPAWANAQNVKSGTVTSSIYFAQLVEALIGAIILAVANNDLTEENDAGQLGILIYVYKYVPINPQYAFYGLNRFLQTKLKTLEIDLNDLVPEPPTSRLAVL